MLPYGVDAAAGGWPMRCSAMRTRATALMLGLIVLLAAAWGGLAAGCSPRDAADRAGSGGLTVVVSLPPLKGIVEPLLPEGSRVEVLIPPGVDEHGYEIPPARLMALTKADLVVYVGLGLEPQVEKMLAEHPRKGQAVVSFAEAVGEEDHAADHDDHDHAHGHGHDHDEHGDDGHEHHHGVDPHLWLDPVLVKRLAETVAARVADAAEARGLDSSETLAGRRDQLVTRIGEVDAAYREFAARLVPGASIVVTHNAYSRLAARYGLAVVPLSGLSGGEPSPSSIQAAIAAVRAQQAAGGGGGEGHNAGAVFVEPQMADGAIRRVAEATGARVLVLDPLGDGDWFSLMNGNLRALREGLDGGHAGE